MSGQKTNRPTAKQKTNSAHSGAFFMGKKMRNTIKVLIALAAIFWSNPAGAVGTIAFSLSQQLDNTGKPLGGCQLYTIQAGTTSTPQNAYKDTGLTLPQPNPMSCDAFGRLPQFFLADGQIKIRLTDVNGNPVFVQDNILVIGPSSGGGGGGAVDPTTILATGDFKMAYGVGPITGFVRCNARTIGSATSGASERANLDAQALFTFLWTNDPNLTVSTGRGASAAADWAANKQITLPDCRGRVIAGLDDMGNTAAGHLTTVGFGACSVVQLGCAGGADNFAMTLNNLPTGITAGMSGSATAPSNFPIAFANATISSLFVTTGSAGPAAGNASGSWGGATSLTVGGTATSNNTGSQAAGGAKGTPSVGPTILTTIYIKL